MPLPATLLARLQKRGLVRQDAPEQVEEVIAESYDDKELEPIEPEPVPEEEFKVQHIFAVADCPNIVNKYHECVEWCQNRWGLKQFSHVEEDEPRRVRMLKKYPLPLGWIEVGDPSSGRCYYWNAETDKVSWLPPQHPRAKITVSAEKLASSLKSTVTRLPSADGGHKEKRKSVSIAVKEPAEDKPKKRRYNKSDELDPMDPAAYSEVERGTWSTGLKSDAKTGVDSTASGPLFQQRPYPSPGEILRAQASASKDDND